ncbi:MAG: hypothetical protein WCF90_07925 [Methanomicrobiales archaeon]
MNFLSDVTGTLSITNNAGCVSDEDLHRTILVNQAKIFSRVLTVAEWLHPV